jgi:hypothetical protein
MMEWAESKPSKTNIRIEGCSEGPTLDTILKE